jgi:hypothetical protein
VMAYHQDPIIDFDSMYTTLPKGIHIMSSGNRNTHVLKLLKNVYSIFREKVKGCLELPSI